MPPSAESQAVDSLYREHHGWLRAWLTNRLSCHNDAEDLTQDTFVQVIKCETASELRSPRSYLMTIARSLVINTFRRRSIEKSYLQSLVHLPEATTISPHQHHETIETLIEVDITLSGLKSHARKAFLLSRVEGLTYKAIAKELNISDRTVKNYMSQAMLRCLIAAENEQS